MLIFRTHIPRDELGVYQSVAEQFERITVQVIAQELELYSNPRGIRTVRVPAGHVAIEISYPPRKPMVLSYNRKVRKALGKPSII